MNFARITILSRNFRNKRKRLKHRFGYDKIKDLFFVVENGNKHFFADINRGLTIYKHGIKNRSKKLLNSYLLHKVDFVESDVIIDCGANYADLFLILKDKIEPENYISFEPGSEEFKAIMENAPQSTNINVGLGNENSIRNFYVNCRQADSSFIEPTAYTEIIEVQTITLEI